jgi:8-oxo-dGTP pyrophosphatase MutT (NUDIX family)
MDRDRRWTVLAERTLVERRWLTIHEQHVRLPNGHEIEEFHLLRGPDWAAVLALTDDAHAVLVRQYRHGADQTSLELPAGIIDAGEDGLAAAQRELLEETGYVADAWHPLAVFSTEPSRHTTRAHFFVATGARAVRDPQTEASEMLETQRVPLRELGSNIDTGAIAHGLHVAALLLAARKGFLELE